MITTVDCISSFDMSHPFLMFIKRPGENVITTFVQVKFASCEPQHLFPLSLLGEYLSIMNEGNENLQGWEVVVKLVLEQFELLGKLVDPACDIVSKSIKWAL